MITTKEKAFERAGELVRSGLWYALPVIDQPHGMLGITMCPTQAGLDRNGEQDDIELMWPRFGKAMEPITKLVSVEELAKIRREGGVESCDDARSLRIGFVRYDLSRHMAFVFHTRLADIRRSAHALGEDFCEMIRTAKSRDPNGFYALREAHHAEVTAAFGPRPQE